VNRAVLEGRGWSRRSSRSATLEEAAAAASRPRTRGEGHAHAAGALYENLPAVSTVRAPPQLICRQNAKPKGTTGTCRTSPPDPQGPDVWLTWIRAELEALRPEQIRANQDAGAAVGRPTADRGRSWATARSLGERGRRVGRLPMKLHTAPVNVLIHGGAGAPAARPIFTFLAELL